MQNEIPDWCKELKKIYEFNPNGIVCDSQIIRTQRSGWGEIRLGSYDNDKYLVRLTNDGKILIRDEEVEDKELIYEALCKLVGR